MVRPPEMLLGPALEERGGLLEGVSTFRVQGGCVMSGPCFRDSTGSLPSPNQCGLVPAISRDLDIAWSPSTECGTPCLYAGFGHSPCKHGTLSDQSSALPLPRGGGTPWCHDSVRGAPTTSQRMLSAVSAGIFAHGSALTHAGLVRTLRGWRNLSVPRVLLVTTGFRGCRRARSHGARPARAAITRSARRGRQPCAKASTPVSEIHRSYQFVFAPVAGGGRPCGCINPGGNNLGMNTVQILRPGVPVSAANAATTYPGCSGARVPRMTGVWMNWCASLGRSLNPVAVCLCILPVGQPVRASTAAAAIREAEGGAGV